MATVKIVCVQCLGQGLTGDPVVVRCPQCSGTGTLSQDDTQTLASIASSTAGINKVSVVVTVPPVLSAAVAKKTSGGKN